MRSAKVGNGQVGECGKGKNVMISLANTPIGVFASNESQARPLTKLGMDTPHRHHLNEGSHDNRGGSTVLTPAKLELFRGGCFK